MIDFELPLILASQSPRRKELLTQIGLKFSVEVADIDETALPQETVDDYVLRVASQKALKISEKYPDSVVIAADTIVSIDYHILQKPESEQHAIAMWQLLSGKTHQVKTTVVVAYQNKIDYRTVSSDISFKVLTLEEMQAYWQTGEPKDKAGGYAIQGLASQWITHLSGSYSAVVGLPLYETVELLKALLNKIQQQ